MGSLLLALIAMPIASCSSSGSEGSIKVGLLVPWSADSYDYFYAMQIVAEDINAAGGIRGRELEVVLYDTQWEPDLAYSLFNLAVDEGAVAMVGGMSSPLAVREAQAALERRVPIVGCCSTSATLTNVQAPGADRFFYRVAPSDRLQSVVIADRAYNHAALGCRNLGIVHVEDAYGTPLSEGVSAAFQALGGTVVATVAHDFFVEDFAAQVATVAAGNPDCIALLSNLDDGRGFRKTWQDAAHPTVKWIGSDSMVGEPLGTTFADPALSQGIYVVFPWSPTTAASTAYNERFMARFGHLPSPYTAGAYDAMAIVALALAESDSLSGDDIRDALVRVGNAPGTLASPADLSGILARIVGGEDVNYSGLSESLEFDACGDVLGEYALIRVDMNAPNQYVNIETGISVTGAASTCPE